MLFGAPEKFTLTLCPADDDVPKQEVRENLQHTGTDRNRNLKRVLAFPYTTKKNKRILFLSVLLLESSLHFLSGKMLIGQEVRANISKRAPTATRT